MADKNDKTRACPIYKEEIKVAATRCIHCHTEIPPGADGRARPPMIMGRRIRAMAHRASAAAGPSSACNDLKIDDAGVWEYIGEDDEYCYYWVRPSAMAPRRHRGRSQVSPRIFAGGTLLPCDGVFRVRCPPASLTWTPAFSHHTPSQLKSGRQKNAGVEALQIAGKWLATDSGGLCYVANATELSKSRSDRDRTCDKRLSGRQRAATNLGVASE